MYKENKIFKRMTILKHVEGKHQFKEMIEAMEEEEIEVIGPSVNGEEDGASGGVGLFAALDMGEETEGEERSRAKEEVGRKRKTPEQGKRERKHSRWETSADIFRSEDESGISSGGSFKESTPKPEVAALRKEVEDLKKENQALVNALNQAVKDKQCRKHCARLQTATSFLERATEGYVMVEEAELRKLEAAARDKTSNKHGGDMVTDWIERAHGLIIESFSTNKE